MRDKKKQSQHIIWPHLHEIFMIGISPETGVDEGLLGAGVGWRMERLLMGTKFLFGIMTMFFK